MDSFNIDNVKAEKAKAMQRYRRFRKIANLFRFVQVCLTMILLYWFLNRLPIAAKISGEYFRVLYVVLVSPRFIFLVGNAIILTLLAKSGQFSGHNSTENSSGTDLYDEFVKNSENRQKIRTDSSSTAPEEIVFQDKHTVCEENSITLTLHQDTKIYRRTQSENLKQSTCLLELRRSETEKCLKVDIFDSKAEKIKTSFSEEEMSNEEFRRTIEAFIAKQMRFRKEESMAIVLKSQS